MNDEKEERSTEEALLEGELERVREAFACAPFRYRGPTLRVVTEPIPPGKDRAERDALRRFECLCRPLPLGVVDGGKLQSVRARLREEFPWMASVTEVVHRQLLVQASLATDGFGGPIRLRPLLLVGPPGTGKTRYVRRLAELLGLAQVILPVGGSSDNRMLEGTSRGWGTGQPSEVLRLIATARRPNPLVCLDEIDKEGSGSHNGRVTDTLHQMLEPENARRWHDAYLLARCDLSAINWVATANEAAQLAPSLRSRLHCVEVRMPRGAELVSVVHGTRADLARELGIPLAHLPRLEDAEWGFLLERMDRGDLTPRLLGRFVRGLLERRVVTPSAGRLLH